ncbi:MAG: HAMP domain-containing histidine kinase [Proteobacteria bacterium]|nr:HAMP domain-containing histidine kinase [Pseudomonadota bacterium]MBU1058282.1 HAMP domain-containing histidine kinase [Pseudomonadota bacterium]
MKIRNRITLWITGAGLVAGLLFSLVIFYELVEQPFALLDAELDSQAHTLLTGLAPQDGKRINLPDNAMLDAIGSLYWFKVFTLQHDLLYASSMTHVIDLPLREKSSAYTLNAQITPKAGDLKRDDSDQITLRVLFLTLPFEGQKYLIQIARPMEKLDEEISELILTITVGLVFFTLVLILLGYFVAGKILQPIAAINTLALQISAQTLDKRIPLAKTEDELYALSSSLNQMFDRLQFSFQHQKEFIANASHELKTPIAMQRLFFDEAIQRDDLPESFKRRLASQAESLFRMKQLVKNLLDLSALEQNEVLHSEPIDLSRLAASIFAEFEEIIQEATIRLSLHIEDKVQLLADREKIQRLLINLIDNAIKYNFKDNGEIRFFLKMKQEKVLMEIYNSSQGIPAEELNLVFDQFYRLEKSRAISLGGSGLGLTIVKRIIELHHGTIHITSEAGSWVRVTILLPCIQPFQRQSVKLED